MQKRKFAVNTSEIGKCFPQPKPCACGEYSIHLHKIVRLLTIEKEPDRATDEENERRDKSNGISRHSCDVMTTSNHILVSHLVMNANIVYNSEWLALTSSHAIKFSCTMYVGDGSVLSCYELVQIRIHLC